MQVAAKAMGFLDPATQGGVVAVIYNGASASSHADADAIAGLFAGGVTAGSATLTAKSVDEKALGDGSGYVAVIVADGADPAAAMAAARAHHVPCITGRADLVQSGTCVMEVRTDPKVDITVNHAAAVSTGVSFLAAFRMLIHEL